MQKCDTMEHEINLSCQKAALAEIVHVDPHFNSLVDDNLIYLIPEYFDNCPSVVELTNALSKRLKTGQLYSIAISCICSYSYSVNHITVSSLTYKDFMSIWGHLETLQRSSSLKLSQWMSTCMCDRSQDGYNNRFRLDAGTPVTMSSNQRNRVRFGSSITPIDIGFVEEYFGIADTLVEAMVADTKMLSALRFIFDKPVLENSTIALKK